MALPYWTKRRRILKKVNEHMEYVKNGESTSLALDSCQRKASSDLQNIGEMDTILTERGHINCSSNNSANMANYRSPLHAASWSSQGPAFPPSFVSREACSEELQLPVREASSNAASRKRQGPALPLSFVSRKAYSEELQLPVREAASNTGSQEHQGPALPLSFVSSKAYSEELQLPVREAASNVGSRERQGPVFFSLPLSFVSRKAYSEELQLPVREAASNAGSRERQEPAVPVQQKDSNNIALQRIFKILEEIKTEQQELKQLLFVRSNDNQHIVCKTFPQATEVEMNGVARKCFIRNRDGGQHRRIKRTTGPALPPSFVSREACSEELQLPVREASSNAASQERQEACSEELQLPVREVDRALQWIFKILEEMKTEQQVMKTEQQELKQLLLSHSDDNQQIGGRAPKDFSFPLKTEEDLQRLEEDLEDRDMKKKMIKYFSCIGGDSVATLVRSVLRRIFSTPLALQYNFTGAKGKKGYNALQVRGVMMTAVWKTFPQATEVEMNDVARKWFISARDRDGGRHRRIKPTTDFGSSSRLSGGAQ